MIKISTFVLTESASASRPNSPIPDLNERYRNPDDKHIVIHNPDNTLKGIQYGEDFVERIPNPDGTLWGVLLRGERIKKGNFKIINLQIFSENSPSNVLFLS